MRVILRSASLLATVRVGGRKVVRGWGRLATEEWVWQDVCTFTCNKL